MRRVINGKDLDKAITLFKKRHYHEVVDLLTPHLLAYGDSYLYFKLMTLSSLMIYDWSGASTFLKTAIRLERYRDNDLRMAHALIRLKWGETIEAYRILFDLERVPKWSRLSREILEISRQTENKQALTEALEEIIRHRLSRISLSDQNKIPQRNRPYEINVSYRKPILISLLSCAIVLLMGIGVYWGIKQLEIRKNYRHDGDSIQLTERDDLTIYDKETAYMLSDKEVKKSFSLLKEYYRKGDNNLAQREINRLKESNAAIDVVDKALAFERLIAKDKDIPLKTFFTYNEVNEDPLLYQKTIVIWRGSLANLIITDTSITFDFLVGYENKKFLEGTVPVYLDFGEKLIEGEAYEIEGEIMVRDRDFSLHGLRVRRIQVKNSENF